MLIDWFTVGAQALNFLILVWLMKRFLYHPILDAIDAREKRIAAELADADAKKAEARNERDEFEHKNEEFDQQRAGFLTKAIEQAKVEGDRLLSEARQAAETLSAKRKETLRREVRNLNQALTRRTQQEVFAIARKALTDLASASLEERMGELFTRRLRALDGDARARLAGAVKASSEPVLVRSAFDLPAEQRAAIQHALNETLSADVPLRFETAPDLVSGIELTANGQKVAWSIADYLASLERGVGELLKEQEKPEPKPAPKPVAKAESKPETKAEPEPKPEDESAPKPDTEAKLKPNAEPKPAAKAEPPTEAKAAPKSEPKATPKPEAGAKPAARAEPKPHNEAAPKPEVKATAEPKPAAPKAAPVES